MCSAGDDDTGLQLCALGAEGLVSVISHILGKQLIELFRRVKTKSEKTRALKEYKKKYEDLLKSVYCETNPIGIKMALKLLGIFSSAEMRSPLVPLESRHTKNLKQALKNTGLL